VSGQRRVLADEVEFILSLASFLQGDFRACEYEQVILPFTAVRQLERAFVSTESEALRGAAGPTLSQRMTADEVTSRAAVIDSLWTIALQENGRACGNTKSRR
jgi:hypothetical protein